MFNQISRPRLTVSQLNLNLPLLAFVNIHRMFLGMHLPLGENSDVPLGNKGRLNPDSTILQGEPPLEHR